MAKSSLFECFIGDLPCSFTWEAGFSSLRVVGSRAPVPFWLFPGGLFQFCHMDLTIGQLPPREGGWAKMEATFLFFAFETNSKIGWEKGYARFVFWTLWIIYCHYGSPLQTLCVFLPHLLNYFYYLFFFWVLVLLSISTYSFNYEDYNSELLAVFPWYWAMELFVDCSWHVGHCVYSFWRQKGLFCRVWDIPESALCLHFVLSVDPLPFPSRWHSANWVRWFPVRPEAFAE